MHERGGRYTARASGQVWLRSLAVHLVPVHSIVGGRVGAPPRIPHKLVDTPGVTSRCHSWSMGSFAPARPSPSPSSIRMRHSVNDDLDLSGRTRNCKSAPASFIGTRTDHSPCRP